MGLRIRGILDRVFTAATGLSVVLLALVLIGVLGPMAYRGAGAVLFQGTVDFRKMQRDLFGRADPEALAAEIARTEPFRRKIYDLLEQLKKGIDVEGMSEQVRAIHRTFGEELRDKDVPADQYTELRTMTREIRDRLEAAFGSQDVEEIRRIVNDDVLRHRDDPRLKGTSAKRFFKIASDFLRAAEQIGDLSKHHDYAAGLENLEHILFHSDADPGLLGLRPDEPMPLLIILRYGATRWDQAQKLLDRFLWVEEWVEQQPAGGAIAGSTSPEPPAQGVAAAEPSQASAATVPARLLVMRRAPRADLFPESFRPLFAYVQENAREMLNPKWTFYWRFFLDDSTGGHYFGGVGPEILGTLVITILGMLFVVPLGIISAAYLVECASDNWMMRIIRMCINTLAGVPSIVFGLFGLAFFVLFLFPALGFESKPCILAASLTLAILALPVMIRAGEEAIRTVPQSYKEGSLALGASRFHTFLTITLPAALPGILTGIILSLGRIAGETAPILFTGAVAMGDVPKSIFEPTRTLSYGSYDLAVGDRIAAMVPHNQYGMVVTLIMLVLVLNALAIALRSHVFRKLRGQ